MLTVVTVVSDVQPELHLLFVEFLSLVRTQKLKYQNDCADEDVLGLGDIENLLAAATTMCFFVSRHFFQLSSPSSPFLCPLVFRLERGLKRTWWDQLSLYLRGLVVCSSFEFFPFHHASPKHCQRATKKPGAKNVPSCLSSMCLYINDHYWGWTTAGRKNHHVCCNLKVILGKNHRTSGSKLINAVKSG